MCDLICLNKFNDGNNNGRVIITSNDDTQIHCHFDFMMMTCKFFESYSSFNSIKNNSNETNDNIIISMKEYSTNAIIHAIKKCYLSAYQFSTDLSFDSIFEIIFILDYFQYEYKDKCYDELIKLYISKITKENWLDALKVIDEINNNMFIKLRDNVFNYVFAKLYIYTNLNDAIENRRIRFKFEEMKNSIGFIIELMLYYGKSWK